MDVPLSIQFARQEQAIREMNGMFDLIKKTKPNDVLCCRHTRYNQNVAHPNAIATPPPNHVIMLHHAPSTCQNALRGRSHRARRPEDTLFEFRDCHAKHIFRATTKSN